MVDRVEANQKHDFLVIASLPAREVETIYSTPEVDPQHQDAIRKVFIRQWRQAIDQYLASGQPRDHDVITHRTENVKTLQREVVGFEGWEQAKRIELAFESDPV